MITIQSAGKRPDRPGLCVQLSLRRTENKLVILLEAGSTGPFTFHTFTGVYLPTLGRVWSPLPGPPLYGSLDLRRCLGPGPETPFEYSGKEISARTKRGGKTTENHQQTESISPTREEKEVVSHFKSEIVSAVP